ncbi:O-acetyl-serine thiol-lyase A (O-acetyl-sulfhydrylase((OAS-TL([[Clostridium] sordellii]|uniref:O-acetyl-serine thiol-lyase A (O-acetyl-sulfhydrylase)(OAS-TL) n=1 Tax=Paraclostridium sordellii TaxID=1505 RepID=A0ABP1XQ28_PARSO|nr:cysteine synthase A [Paeniclostridium sordellii]CEJ73451.1 O-acetyl-serine thiol-lyase A (O-acetyl-sulfhydrylase)(OAS-TL) [[Clostridium] sordellii] [Paeniclostridium sordellii]CEN69002.1 O-acetyl-serine thiol-lyase A (O-acetyl-sulfhydrylase)(OAS-TL) [[Clostridium] sordellii] [Paeniclostridium sordellii]CEN72269.1 O-acetyl-serine thiol-lyase A (O-acetyl-sulfhydrylase)(OAS-TL) [[Clostridium] sordellii] [Paeniclostridium sordellii]CEO23539.1 O-acetyl-serine thiol-lyase A (O-acetyl-sulfhydrylase
MIYNNVLELIGKTPILKLNNIQDNNNIYLKLEKYNSGGSIKDRAVLGMIEDLMIENKIKQGDTIVEATSGNTGIALSMIGKVKGLNIIIVMPSSMSKERIDLMKAYGAEVILTKKGGMQASIDKSIELVNSNESYKSLKQFENESNPKKHYNTTAIEIYEDVENIDIFIAGIGTGGTISGIGKYLKEKNPNIRVIGVEPESSPLISKGYSGAHKIQGIGANFIPKNLDMNIIDEIITVKDDDAINTIKLLGEKEGILVGISSGANVFASIEIGKKYKGKNIVTVSPDGIEKYLSMDIF